MKSSSPQNCCRMCGATSYRHVIARDDSGAMKPTGLYQCSSCSVVFADPKAWREGGDDAPIGSSSPITPLRPSTVTAAQAAASAPFAPRAAPST